MSSMQKQDLLKRLKCGNVRSVLSDVQECFKNEEIEEQLALSLLCGVSNVVTDGSNVDLETEDIYQLCYMCCEALKLENLTSNKYKFLCSLYHITKYLLSKDCIATALKLSNFVFLTRCKVDEEAVCSVYYSYHYLFHHIAVAKKAEYLGRKADLSVTLTIFKHAVKFLGCCTGKFLLHILDKAAQFVYGMNVTDNEHQLEIVQLQIDILGLTCCKEPERCTEIRDETVHKSYMSLLSSILKSLFDKQQHLKGQDVVKKTVECICMWNKKDAVSNDCSVFLQDVLHLLLVRPDDFAKRLEACTRTLESLVLKYRDSKILNWTCITLAHVLHTVNSYWTTQCAEEWNQHMSLHVQRAFFNFVSCLSELLLTSQCIKCIQPSGEECFVNNDTVSSVNLLIILMNCVTLSVVNKSDGFTMVLPNAKMALLEAVVRIKTLKEANCPVWKGIWKRCGIKAYNLYVHCHTAGLILEAKGFLSKFCWTCIQLGEQPLSPKDGSGTLDTGIQHLVQIYKDLKNYWQALRIAAVGLVILPNLKEKFMHLWAKVKNCALTEKCKDVQTLTMFDILKDDKKIENLCPHIDLEAINFPQLLIWELEAYSLSSFSSWQCVKVAYNKFCSLSPKCDILVQGLLAYLPSLWVNGSTEECEEMVSSVENILEALEKERQYVEISKEYQCLLGNLHYWLFLCQLKVKRSKQEEEILNSNVIPVKIQSQQEDNHDPLETCDVTPAYRYLNLENETQILEILNKAVVCWSSALQNEFGAIDDSVNPLPNLEVTAWLYELYGYVTQKLRSWCLYIKYAEALNNTEAKLLGLCHLLEWCTCGMTECKLLTEAEDMTTVLKLESNEQFASQLLFHKYWLARGRHCLRNEKFMKIGDCIEKLVVFTKREKIQHFAQSILHVQTKLLISQCKCLPQPHVITWPSKNEKDVFSEAIETYGNAMSLLKQVKMTPAENAQVLSLMLEVSQWLGQLTLELFWPREARCCMKGDLVLSQKLGLATRTAQFLSVLAQVDIMCCNVNDCQVKLQGIEGVLQLESRFQPHDIACKKQETVADLEIMSQLKQLTLDRSVRRAEFRDSRRVPLRNRSPCGSPNLRKVVFVLPSFVQHQADCHCQMCNTLTLQALVLGAVHIQAEVYSIQSELKETLEFFEGGLQLYQQLVYKQHAIIRKFGPEMRETVHCHGDYGDCFLLLLHPLKLGYIQILRGYADFMAARGSYVQAKKLNANALQEIGNLKLAHPHLAADVMDQTFCIEQAQVASLEPQKNKEECTLQVQETPSLALHESMKTPINTSSLSRHIFRPLSVSNIKICEHSPIKIKPRKLVLPENENDDSEKENKQTLNGTSVKKTRIHTRKQKQSKTMIVFEDSPTVAQIGKLLPSSSNVQQRSTRTLRSKTSHKETRYGASEHESLSKVCQALEIKIDSPGGSSEIHQFSVENRKQGSSVNNTKALPTHVIDGDEADVAYLGLEGLDVSISDINNEVSEIMDSVPASKQAGPICREPGAKHASALKAPKLRTYSRQNNTVQFKNKCRTSQEDENEGGTISAVKENKTTKMAGKQSRSSSKGMKKMSPDSSLTTKKTRGRGKSAASSASMSGSSKSSLHRNLKENLVKDMANITLESENFKLGNANDTTENSKEGKSHTKVKKASEFLFTPSRTNARKKHNETIVPSSPDEHLDTSRKTTVQPKENMGNERRKKVVSSSSASEEEKPSNLKALVSSDKDTTLQEMKPRKGVSSSKKKQVLLRHPFILN